MTCLFFLPLILLGSTTRRRWKKMLILVWKRRGGRKPAANFSLRGNGSVFLSFFSLLSFFINTATHSLSGKCVSLILFVTFSVTFSTSFFWPLKRSRGATSTDSQRSTMTVPSEESACTVLLCHFKAEAKHSCGQHTIQQ